MAREHSLNQFVRCLSEKCGFGVNLVTVCLTDPESQYCVYPLQKGAKIRWIEAPGTHLKVIQRSLLDHTLYALRVTDYAHGFVPGRSIVTNAKLHVQKQWVVTLDIKNFFPSITSQQVRGVLDGLGGEPEVLAAMTRLFTRHGRLPQGAPTSPHLANLVASALDQRLGEAVAAMGWVYTRYADDLTFSGDTPPQGLVREVEHQLNRHGFRAARGKTHVMGRSQRQVVTGLVVNDRVRLPKPQRRRLRAMLHRADGLGDPEAFDPVLQGHLAFARFVSREAYQWEAEQLISLGRQTDPFEASPSALDAGQ